MTVAITRNLPDRFDGFLKSCMHEIAPGVYVAPKMNKGVRERLWTVMMKWSEAIPEDGGIVLFWSSKKAPSGLAFNLLGWPKKELKEHEGFWLTFSKLTKAQSIIELNKQDQSNRADTQNYENDGPTIHEY